MSDVLLFQTVDNGNINVVNGQTELTDGFETAVYISLFGGNEADDGTDGNSQNWWGNLDENDPSGVIRSETGYIINMSRPIPANLGNIEDAAVRDLQWMIDSGAASSVEATASMPGLNRVNLSITIRAEGEETQFTFSENWKASA